MTKRKTNTRGQQKPRARRRQVEVLDLAAEQARTERGARRIKALFDAGNGVPDFITDAVMVALHLAEFKTGVGFWQVEAGNIMGEDFDLKGLATLLTVTDSRDIELEPKKDLSELLSAVLRHADTPEVIAEAIRAAMCQINEDVSDPAAHRPHSRSHPACGREGRRVNAPLNRLPRGAAPRATTQPPQATRPAPPLTLAAPAQTPAPRARAGREGLRPRASGAGSVCNHARPLHPQPQTLAKGI